MARSLITEDYYQVLEIRQTDDAATIKSSYRRLARLRHPDKRLNDPTATAQFQLLQAAYNTLIDVRKREIYDSYYPRIRSNRQTTSGNGGDFPYQAGAAPQTGTQPESPPDSEKSQQEKRRMEQLRRILGDLEGRRRNLEAESFKVQQALNRIQEVLDRLQGEEDKDVQEDATRNGWFAFLFSTRESPQEKEVRERRATERRTGRIVREAEFRTRKTKFEELGAQLGDLSAKIATARLNVSEEWLRQQERQKAEQLRQDAEMLKRSQERNERLRQEEARKKREEEQRRREMREKLRQEEARKEREEEQRRQEMREKLRQEEARRERQEEQRRQEEARKERLQRTCQHRGWWARVEGRRRCGHCSHVTTRFAFECPGCLMTACAGCRIILKGQGR